MSKKFKSIDEIKAYYKEQLKPIKAARQAAIKEFKAKCKHPKSARLTSRKHTRSEIFYDGYQPPGAPDYSYGHWKIVHCSKCGKELSKKYYDDGDR